MNFCVNFSIGCGTTHCYDLLPFINYRMGAMVFYSYIPFILLQLHDYSKTPSAELEVKFQLSKVTLEPMLRSMAYISDQLSTPANRVAVINLKV